MKSMEHSLRLQDVINLANPGSWAASILPSILATAISYKLNGSIRPDMAVCLFLIRSDWNALLIYLLGLPVCAGLMGRQFGMAPESQNRPMIMGGIASLNIILGLLYYVAVLISDISFA